MFVFMILVIGLLFLLLAVVASMRPSFQMISSFELERLASHGDVHAKQMLRQKKFATELSSLVQLAIVALVVLFTLIATAFFGWVTGGVAVLLAVVAYQPVSRFSFIHAWAQKIYTQLEPKLITGFEQYPVLKMLRGFSQTRSDGLSIHSREEFLHEVSTLKNTILHEREKKFIISGLQFNKQKVLSIMTPHDDIVSIKHDELLGPLALDELHKTGHSRFPVIDTDGNSIIGVVDIDNLVTLIDKKSPRARDVMSRPIHTVRETETLERVLGVFLETKQSLLIVTDVQSKTVGLVCLEDVTTALFGRALNGNLSSDAVSNLE